MPRAVCQPPADKSGRAVDRRGARAIVFGVAAVAALAAAPVNGQSPTLTGAVPRAVRPGETTEVTLRGSSLSKPLSIVGSTLPPGTISSISSTDDRANWKASVGREVPVGIVAIRVATRNGVSNLLPFMVDDLPSVAEAGGNATPQTAQAVTPPVAVDGACDANASDYYRFTAKKGQRVSVEVVAARLGSQLDPVVWLLDAGGKELLALDDTPGIGPDCRFARTFDADGEYLIEVRDSGYSGGAEFHYRLRVGDFPLATVPFPLGCRRLTQPAFNFIGADCDSVAPVKLEPIAFGKQVPLSVRYEGERGKAGGSGFVSAVVEEHPEAVESEPNDTPESATRLPALPVALSGRFDRPNDRDFYQLPVKMGDRLTFAARTRSLGSPCDVRLVVFKPDGSKLAESKVEGASEGSLDATFPDDGPYRLLVEEINRAGGPGLAYRVVVEPYKPGFALAVDTDRVSAKPGESFEVKVTSVRRDYAGPIALAVDSGGLTSEPATIPAGKNEAVLKGNVPTGKQPGGPLPFRIIGRAAINDEEFTAEASTMSVLRRLYPKLLYPPDELDGVLVLGVRAAGE